ncbi:medium-chain acyl-CoA ligase ACSF2, mitochondrial-like [Periplaneta americana]|uniref:medium-chain acyl-CoA ligase ACSF2, mitochondrial-like n=1 Tax=Periplaneta americana TaxID=6978 RepID=UPI0037E71194
MSSRKYKPSYWHNPGAEPLCCLTLGQLVDQAVEQWGDKEAMVSLYQGHRFTFREARDKADRLAAGLLQMGLNPGDRLGIWGPSSSEWYISRVAAARGGFIAVQLDPAYQAPQLLHGLSKVDVKFIICSEFYKTNSCYEILRKVIPELDSCPESGVKLQTIKTPALEAVILMSDKQYLGAYRLNDIIASARSEYIQKVRDLQTIIQADEGCVIQFSSGTTGTPKGAFLSHHNLVNNVIGMRKGFECDIKDAKSAVITQFCHTAGSLTGVICGLYYGVTCVLPAPVFDAKKTLEAIIQERCTHMFATPSLFVDMISVATELGLQVTSLRAAMYGGAPCSQQLALKIKEVLNVRKLTPAYGMTEVTVVFFSQPQDTLEQMTATVGYLMEHVEVKVVDKEGRMVPMGTPGELWVRGYNVMLGYWKDEEKTRQFIGPDGWAKTGDEFVLQEDGYGRIVGRVKDVIIRIGDKIFPTEIEDFFMEHPDVLEAQVFGVPDNRVGEEIGMYLRLREGARLNEQDVRNYCKDKLPEFRIPRYIRFIKEFERTAIGKVQKFRLLEKLQKELGISK